MPQKMMRDIRDPDEVYPDPPGRLSGPTFYHGLANTAFAEEPSATRLFAGLPGDIERDIRRDTAVERARLADERKAEADKAAEDKRPR